MHTRTLLSHAILKLPLTVRVIVPIGAGPHAVPPHSFMLRLSHKWGRWQGIFCAQVAVGISVICACDFAACCTCYCAVGGQAAAVSCRGRKKPTAHHNTTTQHVTSTTSM
jgi:hypothetical protein